MDRFTDLRFGDMTGMVTQAALRAALQESEEHYRWSVALSPQVPWTANVLGSIEEVGPRWQELTGFSPSTALGTGWISALHTEDIAPTLIKWSDHLQSGEPFDIEYRLKLRNGEYRWMRARAAARRNLEGEILRWYGTLEDVHDQKIAQKALAESEERLRLAVQSTRLGIWDFDGITGERTWSPEFREMLGVPLDCEPTKELALKVVHPDDRAELVALMNTVAQQSLPANFEATLRVFRQDNGELRWIKSVGGTTMSESGRVQRILVVFQDVTSEREAEQRIRWTATHDTMTKMPNRGRWQSTLDCMTDEAARKGHPFGLILFDIDDLKRANDMYGHDAGDALLIAFADRLREAAPEDSVLGRLGGDEFGLIATSLADEESLERFSEGLLDRLRKPYQYEGWILECGASIGAAIFGRHGDRAQDLLKAADLALYRSKTSGGGRLTLFQPLLRAEAQKRHSMLEMGRKALADDMIVPYYQPKVLLRTGEVLGYEALLRWCHPRLGIQSPDSILAAFDHPEISVGLTERMFHAVIRDLADWLNGGCDPGRIAINVSAADFMDDGFADAVLERLRKFDVPTRNIEIEVTETVFLGRGADQVEKTLRTFSREGIRIALDDFGTGYASLTHLKQFPVDVLKIDRSFVRNIEEDAGDSAIVDAILRLGGSFGLDVVAEGVETAGQAECLLRRGCLLAQGFYFGRPSSGETLFPK